MMIEYTTYSVAATYILWVFYLAVMNLKRNRAYIDMVVIVPAYFTLFIGWVLDFLVNIFVMTVVCLDLPRELTVTARMKRYTSSKPTSKLQRYRKRFAAQFCGRFLDKFDPSGTHCGG